MDEVLDKLENTTITRPDPDEKFTNFENLYKNWGKLGGQEERRKQLLETQRNNRNNKLDKVRGIFELVNAVEQNDIFCRSIRSDYRPNIYVAGFTKAPSYGDVLMLSEWMVEKPYDFAENWLVVPCPKGLRMLVVANNGYTKFYTKYGHLKFECKTALPGGSWQPKRGNCCVLDGIYDKHNNVFYILDVIAWNNQTMTDGEAEFRQYWLENQSTDYLPHLKKIDSRNEVLFSILPKTPCDDDSLSKFMMKFPHFDNNVPATDGLLFYHKKAHYVSGETPLVGWLYPFMVPEIIGKDIPIHQVYSLERPEDYTCQTDFIIKFEEKHSKKKQRVYRDKKVSSKENEMDTLDNNTVAPKSCKKNSKKKSGAKEKTETETMESETIEANADDMEAEAVKETETENSEVQD